MKVRDNRICSRILPGLLVFMVAFLHSVHGFTLPRPQNHPTKLLAETASPPFVNEVRESGSAAPSSTTTTATTNGNGGTSSSGSTTTGSSSNTGSSSTRQLMGNWEELHGNYVLRPNDASAQPRALLHFLGGAIVGAVPHVSYRYMLERLAAKGFLVVATPYNLSFDHLDTCDAVIQRFEKIAPMLARQYGPVPVVGVGHSCGALLQLLITSLFPDTPRAANALLSFNNKPVKEAVPFFEEIVAPLFKSIANKNSTFPSSSELIGLSLQLARATSRGELPSDELLSEVVKVLTPNVNGVTPPSIGIPSSVRDAVETIMSPSTAALSEVGVLPLVGQVVDTLEQIPLLIDEVANGASDFIPNPSSVRAAARRTYRARRTLILEFADDGLDESAEIENLLKEAESVTRMKRPMITIDVQRTTLPGGHATPLLAPPLDITSRAEDILGPETAKEQLLYSQTDATVNELVRWLEEGNL